MHATYASACIACRADDTQSISGTSGFITDTGAHIRVSCGCTDAQQDVSNSCFRAASWCSSGGGCKRSTRRVLSRTSDSQAVFVVYTVAAPAADVGISSFAHTAGVRAASVCRTAGPRVSAEAEKRIHPTAATAANRSIAENARVSTSPAGAARPRSRAREAASASA